MASTLLQPYELPPYELVKLVHPAFSAHSILPGSVSGTSPALSGASSPPSSSHGPASSSPNSLGGRFSQFVNAKSTAGATAHRPGSSADFTGGSHGGQSNITGGPIPSTSKQVIRTAEAGGDTLWIAGNEGAVSVWKIDPSRSKGKQRALDETDNVQAGSVEEASYLLDQYGVVPGRRPVEKLAVLSTVGKAIVLSEGVLTFHSLPTFAPLPAFGPLRGVSTFAVDLSDPHAAFVPVCVIKRKSMQVYHVSQFSIEHVQDIPQRSTAILGVLRKGCLCIADSVSYALVDLQSVTLTPLLDISQDPSDERDEDGNAVQSRPKSHQRPAILAVGADEFLIVSHTGNTALGVFIKENGDPTRGTLEWASNPRSIAIEHPYVIALLQNNTIEIHSLHTQEIVQVLSLANILKQPSSTPSSPALGSFTSPSTPATSQGIQPRALISCSAGFPHRDAQADGAKPFSPLLVPQSRGSDSLEKVKVKLFPTPSLLDSVDEDTGRVDALPSTPTTPRKIPKRSGSALAQTRPLASGSRTLTVSTLAVGTLVLGRDSGFALCPLTLVAQADALIGRSRAEDALKLLEAVGGPRTTEELEEHCYTKQRAAWSYIFETRFKDAGSLFSESRTDPRLLLRLFPDLCGKMFDTSLSSEVAIYQGLEGQLRSGEGALPKTDIDDIIRNYSPHLPPSSPSVTDLHGKLEKQARIMIRDFLERWRSTRRTEGFESLGIDNRDTDLVQDLDRLVDTVLLKLYLEDPKSHEMAISILDKESHDGDVDELAPLLEKQGLHWYLSQLYLLQSRRAAALAIYRDLIDGRREDPRFTDGLDKIYTLLESSSDAEEVVEYGLWLTEHDEELGIKLLTRSNKDVQLDVAKCSTRLKEISQGAADKFLESIVWTRRNIEAKYHDELLDRYLTQLNGIFASSALAEQLRAVRREYAETAQATSLSLVSYALSKDVDSDAMALRAKLIILLHASNMYDVHKVRSKLDGMKELLFEKAIVLGKLGLHDAVLTILARDLRDLVAAEAYCAHGETGDVLGPKNVREILEKLSISRPTALLRRDGRKRSAPTITLTQDERESKRRELLNLLIKITLSLTADSGEGDNKSVSHLSRARTAKVIETQAIRIDALNILPSIPDEWPLELMQSFVVRSMRRTLHVKHEAKLTKALWSGKSLEVEDRWYREMEAMGGVLAEEAENDSHAREEVVYLEKGQDPDALDEKAVDLDLS